MKALVYTHYGSPDVLHFRKVPKPVPAENEILIKIHATTVNRTDNAMIKAKPFFARLITGLIKPKYTTPGTEFAGVIEVVGSKVPSLQVGDKVFGFYDMGSGAHAEYLTVPHNMAVTIPDDINFQQAAASSEGAHYAYNFLNKVKLEKGQKVLVNGATGAIGSAAVQLLKYFELEVTAVCGTQNLELVKSLGADRVIDYKSQDFIRDHERYHYVFDTVGKSSFFKCRKLLLPGGVYMSSDLGYLAQNIYLPIITQLIKPLLGDKKMLFPFPNNIAQSLQLVRKLMQDGRFKAVIDRTYPFDDIIEAYRYVEKGHKIGNVVILIQ